MSTEQDNFAGMTAEQKVKALILIRGRAWDQAVESISKESVDDQWKAWNVLGNLADASEEVREGEIETGLDCESDRNYESKAVAAQLPDGSWVGWTYWYGGGKHGYPREIEWMPDAYDVTCTEEQKLVTVQTFAKVGA
mgnify:FL=1